MKITNKALWKSFQEPGRCEWCGLYASKREAHHLRTRNPEITVRINLLSVGASKLFCCSCHRDIHDGHIPRGKVLERVAVRENVTVDLITECMDFFQRLIKPTSVQLERSLLELWPSAYFLAVKELTEAGILTIQGV